MKVFSKDLTYEKEQGGLPSSFQQVEWIASSGTQYIRTGIVPSVNTFYDMKIESTYNVGFFVFGCDKGWEDDAFGFQGLSRNWYIGFYNNTYQSIYPSIKSNLSVVSYREANKIVIDTTQYTVTTNAINNDLEIYLFGINRNDTAVDLSTGTLYYLKFYDNETLIADFVPCYRKSDGEIGLYDLVRKEFYTNAGSGTFNKGGDV